MWRLGRRNWRWEVRRLFSSSSAAARGVIADEGDWSYADEWWGDGGQTVFRSSSDQGNGVISVIAYPSTRPVLLPALDLYTSLFFRNPKASSLCCLALKYFFSIIFLDEVTQKNILTAGSPMNLDNV